MSWNHCSKSSMIRKKITILWMKQCASLKKISPRLNINIRLQIIDKLRLPNKHKNCQELLKLQKLPMRVKRHLMKIYCLKLMSWRRRWSICNKKWKMNSRLLKTSCNLNLISTQLTFNKTRRWMTRLEIWLKICREFLKKICKKYSTSKRKMRSLRNKNKNINK